MNPLVSILLPTYNRADLLKQALQSCFAQTLDDLEIVVVVDGSTDETMNYLATIKDKRLQVHYQENRGLSESLNTAMKFAKGKFYQILDDDDTLPPGSSKIMSDYLVNHPDVGTDFGELIVIGKNGKVRNCYRVTNAKKHLEMIGRVWHWSKPMMRREAAEKTGGFNNEFNNVQDVDYFIRLRSNVKLAMIQVPVYEYRIHPGSSMIERYYVFIIPALKMSLFHIDAGRISPNENTPKRLYSIYIKAACYTKKDKRAEILNQIIELAKQRKEPFVKSLIRKSHVFNTWLGRRWIRIGYLRNGLFLHLDNLFNKLISRQYKQITTG
jgi:glycosyltransferase involved in cell wall biosynthesis